MDYYVSAISKVVGLLMIVNDFVIHSYNYLLLQGKAVMHDPFAMRPFFGYNFGHYLEHWLSMEKLEGVKLPKIFHVNWFRKSDQVSKNLFM